jgi:hypothetical protein
VSLDVHWTTAIPLTLGLEAAVLAVTAGVGALLVRLLRVIDLPTRSGPADGTDPGSDGGRGAGPGPSRPPHPGPEPVWWWPQFERQFADWVADGTAGRC